MEAQEAEDLLEDLGIPVQIYLSPFLSLQNLEEKTV